MILVVVVVLSRLTESWRVRACLRNGTVLVPIFKKKGDVQNSNNYSGIKLVSHTTEMCEGIFEARLSRLVTINKEQYGFILRKASADAMFALSFWI